MMLRKLLFLLLFVTYDFLLCFLLSLVAFKRVELHHLPVSSALFTRSRFLILIFSYYANLLFALYILLIIC